MTKTHTNSFSQISVSTRRLLAATFLIISCLLPSIAQAQSGLSDDVKAKAVSVAQQIETNNLIISPNLSLENLGLETMTPQQKLVTLRILAMDALILRNTLDKDNIVSRYSEEAALQNNARDLEIAKIFQLFAATGKLDIESDKTAKLHLQLETYIDNENWFIANRANLILAVYNSKQLKLGTALSQAQTALDLIPNGLGVETSEASFETNDIISYLQVLLVNPDLAVNAADQVIRQGLEQNRQVDGIGFISNLIFVFDKWRDFETASQLAEIMLNITEKNDLENIGMAYYRYGQSLNNFGQYTKASQYLRKALRAENDNVVRLNLESQLAISLAGLGDQNGAKASFVRFDELSARVDINTKGYAKRRLQAETLLAVSQNNASKTYELMNQRLDGELLGTFRRIGRTTQTQLAELQNSKERQKDREEALKRENVLKQKELEAKHRSLILLAGLVVALLIALAVILFAVVRLAIARKEVAAAHKLALHASQAGERAKQQFLSVMSHELRTPLNGIIGIADLLSVEGETKQLRDQTKIILQSGNNLLELLTGIMNMTQMEAGALTIYTAPTAMQQLANSVYETFKTQTNSDEIIFTCFVANCVPDDLMLDSVRLKEALTHLVSNAVKFTEKGRIHIHVTAEEADELTYKRTLNIIVADTGMGISEAIESKLFMPFVQADSSMTRAHGGAGIGLAVTRGLARLMGGDVKLTSRSGRGSEFLLTVQTCAASDSPVDVETGQPVFEVEPNPEEPVNFTPAVTIEELQRDEDTRIDPNKAIFDAHISALTAKKVAAERARNLAAETDDDYVFADLLSEEPDQEMEILAPPEHRGVFSRQQPRPNDRVVSHDQLNGLNVLIVEDILANQEVLRSLLEPVGCTVCGAENGQEALELMETQIFDVVLMDIRMPIMDGVETTEAIRKTPGPHQNVPIIALTADASAENNAQCLAAGANVFLTKPVVVSELLSSIRFVREKQLYQKQKTQTA